MSDIHDDVERENDRRISPPDSERDRRLQREFEAAEARFIADLPEALQKALRSPETLSEVDFNFDLHSGRLWFAFSATASRENQDALGMVLRKLADAVTDAEIPTGET